jgi:lysophospholipase L1-like esterase
MTSRKAGCLLQVQKRMWAMRHVLLTVLMSGPIPTLAAAADGSANDATNTYTTPTPAGSQALHQMFTVIGGKDMEALKCSTPQRRKTPELKPTPTVNDSQRQDPAPAGSDEEIIPLTEAEERVMLKKALAPPSTNDLRRNLPKSEWIKKFHETLASASRERVARIGLWGGSHMSAEFFSSELRYALQERYGAGGAGHINLLYGRPGLNLPVTSFCRSGEWREELPPRTINSPKISAGLGLYAMTSVTSNAALEADLRSSQARYRAQQITLHFLRQPEGGSFELIVDGETLGTIETQGPQAIGIVDIKSALPMSRIEVRVTESKRVTLLGLFAEDLQGAVLDNFGIAGAAGNYWRTVEPEFFTAALTDRTYDAVILAYGTNDVTGKTWNPERYRQDYRQTLIAMRAALPQAACILIPPGDRVTRYTVKKNVKVKVGKRKTVNKTQITTHYDLQTYPARHAQAAAIQRELGDEYQCMVWDMSLVMREMGGAYALMKRSPPWMANDLIHLTPAGYREMARRFIGWLELASGKTP